MSKIDVTRTIAIDARPLAGVHNGYTTYLGFIIAALKKANFAITLLSNQKLRAAYKMIEGCEVEIVGPSSQWRWERQFVGRYLQDHHYDLYFAGANRGMPPQRIKQTRKILGLLDTIPYKLARHYIFKYPYHFARHELAAQLSSVKNADEVITISQNSAKDIRGYVKHKPVTALLLPLHPAKPRQSAVPHKQFVYLGGVDPRKKIANLLKAFAMFNREHPDYSLILIGRGYEAFDGLVKKLNLQKSIRLTGYIDDDTKFEILQNSTALVYPSLYEGYGLAIAEGLLADTVVIAGRGGAQLEVGGKAVLYIDPNSPQSISQAMQKVLDPDVRAELKAQRNQQSKKITDPILEEKIGQYFQQQVMRARQL